MRFHHVPGHDNGCIDAGGGDARCSRHTVSTAREQVGNPIGGLAGPIHCNVPARHALHAPTLERAVDAGENLLQLGVTHPVRLSHGQQHFPAHPRAQCGNHPLLRGRNRIEHREWFIHPHLERVRGAPDEWDAGGEFEHSRSMPKPACEALKPSTGRASA
jgi:hypothetical protein